MLRRLASALVFAAVSGMSAGAHAFGGWMAQAGFQPVEQRVAVAVTPQRTTLWTSLRFSAYGGSIGVVVPVPPGASVDIASDAWFEALEVATAPRVFPPPGQDPECPGVPVGPFLPYDTAGHTEHTQSAALVESALLADAAAIHGWATARGLVMSTGLQAGLGSVSGARFLALRFQAPLAPGLTPTVRVAIPGTIPSLPLSLTTASGGDLLVTTWILGSGRGRLDGSADATIVDSSLVWDAEAQASTYASERRAVLGSGADSLTEAAGHDGIAADVPIYGSVTIDGVLHTYFERATAYDGEPVDPAACLPPAAAVLSSTEVVAASCPRAELIAPPAPCVEAPPAGTIDPAVLRCGKDADDVAVALSGAFGAGLWLTRQSLVIQDGDHGYDWHVSFDPDPTPVLPVRMTEFVDTSSCPGSSWPWPGGEGGQGGATAWQPGGTHSGGISGSADIDLSGIDDALSHLGDGCDGSSAESGSCGGDSGGSCEGGDVGGGSCGGGDFGGGSCGGGGGSFECSTTRRRAPRPFPMIVAVLAALAPLRRRGTAARRRLSK